MTRGDVQDVTGTVKLCTGQLFGIEAAVHAVRSLFYEARTEGALLVDASTAFNSLNRRVALPTFDAFALPWPTSSSTPTTNQ